jgi:hypothetical protein
MRSSRSSPALLAILEKSSEHRQSSSGDWRRRFEKAEEVAGCIAPAAGAPSAHRPVSHEREVKATQPGWGGMEGREAAAEVSNPPVSAALRTKSVHLRRPGSWSDLNAAMAQLNFSESGVFAEPAACSGRRDGSAPLDSDSDDDRIPTHNRHSL